MIFWRAVQGFIGGGMIPTVFSAAFSIFPREKQSIVTPLIGLVATLAPTIGPTLGGLLTDAFSWHWLFLVNVPPGIAVCLICWAMIDFDEPELSLLKGFDWTGLAGMGVFLGALEYVLEEGPGKGWFDSEVIMIAAAISTLGGLVFFWRAFTVANPIVDLTAFKDRNFWTGSLFSLTLGVGLYGLTYLYPVYLARVRGYSALMIGNTMFVTGICSFLSAPIVGRLSTKIDPRLMIGLGFIGFAAGTFQASYVTKDWDFYELLLPQILRGVGLMFCIVPITSIALGTLPPQKLKNASGLFNLTRNLGGAIGLALINTLLNDRTDLHLARLHESLSWGHTKAEETLANLTQAYATLGSDAELAAIKRMALLARRESLVMALGDVFFVMTITFICLVPLVFIMRRPRPLGTNAGH
jgi:DHA2 family multidrug resistance protein